MTTSTHSIYGLIGFPLGHSFSQNFFNQKFKTEGIDAEYVNFEIPSIEDFRELLKKNPNLKGLNVTIPYKEKVIPYLNELDPQAAAIGAVNVIKISRNSKGNITHLKGYNSDIIGFVDSIRSLIQSWHKNALVLGTGGASKAVVKGLESLGITSKLVSRTPNDNRLTYDTLGSATIANSTIIVNTTPLGMYPKINECPDIDYDSISSNHLCYDLLYNPDTTLFMQKCAERGAVTKNGLEMLLMQAFAAWNIWNSDH